ncbi:hypothetical protein IJ765_00495 [Candidatus Saccharibacteria bacterium]|nr:hypothetical protein [Candidatus Saccharibacteria bacterium]
MKRFQRGLSIGLFGLGLVFGTHLTTRLVSADDVVLSDEQRGAISTNCDSLKSTLKNLQRVDSRTRSFLGAAYDKFLSSYISPLSLRMVANNRLSTSLTGIHSGILNSREVFVAQFTSYSQSFEELLQVDCKTQPEEFYRKLVATRKKRTMLESTVTSLRSALGNHYTAVEKFRSEM